MNLSIKLLSATAFAVTALSLASCQEEDFGFDAKQVAYYENFIRSFGKIDPEQDWNLATRCSANVSLDETATVKIYSENPLATGAKLIANYEVKNSRTFQFDLPEGTKEVFVQAVSKRGSIVSGYYNVVDGVVDVNARKANTGTRASDPCSTTIATGDPTFVHVYYGTVYDQDANGGYGANVPVTKNIKMHNLEGVSSERSTPWRLGDFRKVLDKYTDANGSLKNGVFKEYQNNWLDWVESGNLSNNVMFTMAETGPVSVTLNYRCTSTYTNQLAYFYWEGNTIPNPEDVTLYNLIPYATGDNDLVLKGSEKLSGNSDIWGSSDDLMITGTTFDLVYFGGATPSYNFPQGIHIAFAVVQDRGDNITGAAEYSTDACWFSIQDMNPVSSYYTNSNFGDAYNNKPFPAAATFRMGDITFLGFEDWPNELSDRGSAPKGGSDLNDILFFAVGNFEEEIPDIDPDPVKDTQDWMLIYEDLGNSFDWDYNDIVLKVEHASGENTAYITALAAGGTLSSHVFYNSTDLGEIHNAWFGLAPQTSGNNIVTNADDRGTAGTRKDITVDGETFSMTTLGSINQMGGIILKVKKEGESDFSSEATTIAYSLDDKGSAPEVICLPASWKYVNSDGKTIKREFRWPKEINHIDDAYPHFKDWAANKNLYPGWYAEDPVLNYCVTGTFETEVSSPSAGGGESGGSNPPVISGPSLNSPYTVSQQEVRAGSSLAPIALASSLFLEEATSIEITLTNTTGGTSGWSYYLRTNGDSSNATVGNYGNDWDTSGVAVIWTITDATILANLKNGNYYIGGIFCLAASNITITVTNK